MITLVVYPLLQTSKGRVPGEFEQASVHLEEGQTRIECPDPGLRSRLADIFSTLVRVRRPVGDDPNVVAWEVRDLLPDTEAFFEEMRHQLHRHMLTARLLTR